jgi:hypothetical protein
MTTVSDLVTLALRDANVIGEGDTASGDQMQDALATLNQMLAVWAVENTYVYAQQEVSFTPTGATSYTVGSGANVSMVRPSKIDGAFWRDGGIDYPITMLDTFEQWEAIPQKTQAGEPLLAFYLPSVTTGTLYLYPQPSTGAVHMIAQATIPTDYESADTITLPAEYLLPVRMNLYVLLAGMHGAPLKPALAKAADLSLKTLKRSNLRIQPLTMPGGIPGNGRGNIISGV